MAGQRVKLVGFLVLVCLVAGLVRRVTPSSPHSNWPTHHGLMTLAPGHLHGRWEAVRASLDLPPLPHDITFTPRPDITLADRAEKRASRFDLGRKRREQEAARRLPPLHFALDTRPFQPNMTVTPIATI